MLLLEYIYIYLFPVKTFLNSKYVTFVNAKLTNRLLYSFLKGFEFSIMLSMNILNGSPLRYFI